MSTASRTRSPDAPQALYLAEPADYLAAHWLRQHPDARNVVLLTEPPGLEAAQAFAQQHAAVTAACVPADDGAAAQTYGTDRVTLPLSLPQTPLRHYPDVALPEMDLAYPAVRRLWRAGFRTFAFYSLAGEFERTIPHLLDGFAGKHAGQRAFVIGNGPSLTAEDVRRLRDEITFGANRCYLGYEQWGFAFTYWGVVDWLQVEEYGLEYIERIPAATPKLFSFEYLPLLDFDQACPVHLRPCDPHLPEFSAGPGGLVMGSSVTYMLLQAAAAMGCNPIILLGVDHSYNLAMPAHKQRSLLPRGVRRAIKWGERRFEGTLVEDVLTARRQRRARLRRTAYTEGHFWTAEHAQDPTHFADDYTEARRFTVPHLEWSAAQYACAAQWAREAGVEILNASRRTALEAFPKVDFDNLF